MRLSLAVRIFIGFGLVVAAFGAVAIYGVGQLNTTRNYLNTVNRGLLPLSQTAGEMKTLDEVTRKTIDSILHVEDLNRQKDLLKRRRDFFSRSLESLTQEMMLAISQPEHLPETSGGGAFYPQVRRHLEEIRRLRGTLVEALAVVIDSIDPESGMAADGAALENFHRQERTLSAVVRLLNLMIRSRIGSVMLQMENRANSSSEGVLWLSALAGLLSFLGALLLLLALRPINRLMDAARRISRGEFSHQVEYSGPDEFGRLASEFNRMARSLASREEEVMKQQQETERVNRMLRQSGLDLELIKLYNENIIRSIPAAVLVLDPQGRVTTLNPGAVKLWALEQEKTMGMALSDLPIAGALGAIISSWSAVLRDRERLVFEAVEFDVPESGQSPPRKALVDLLISPLLGADGNVQGVLVVGEDVTDKVRTKQALIQSERLATIGRMAAMVAHEIRNPLSSIALNAELLREELVEKLGAEGVEAREILSGVSREVDRLTEVTEEYLRFARMPKPRLEAERLQDILRDLLRFVDGELRAGGIEVRCELGDDLSPVQADENQIRQAFLNLFRNSMESMPDGGVLTIGAEQADGLVRIRISDTGRGISCETMAHLFEPFFSTRENGTGLGLSLTQHIVSEHGGRISCASQPGQGTSFLVELPAARTPGGD